MTPQEQALIDRFNTATNAVAARIRDLVANPPPDAAFNDALAGIATQLEAMGANGQPPPTP